MLLTSGSPFAAPLTRMSASEAETVQAVPSCRWLEAAIQKPPVPPASTASVSARESVPDVAESTTTAYVVLAASVVPAGAANVRLPAASDDGVVSAACSVPSRLPRWTFTFTVEFGAVPNFTSMPVRL